MKARLELTLLRCFSYVNHVVVKLSIEASATKLEFPNLILLLKYLCTVFIIKRV